MITTLYEAVNVATSFRVRELTDHVFDDITHHVSNGKMDLHTHKALRTATIEAANNVVYESFSVTHAALSQ